MTTRLARRGLHPGDLGLGTAQLGDLFHRLTDAEATAIVDTAWEAGIRYFDTAPHYGLGLAEARLGTALRQRERDDYVLSTKVGRLIVDDGAGERTRVFDFSASGVARSLDASRERLGVDRIDIALIHDPEGHAEQAVSAAYPALAALRDRGEIGAVGVGTKDVATLLRVVERTDVDAVMVAGRLTLLDHSAADELVPLCAERGVAILNAGVFNSGILAGDAPASTSHFDYGEPSSRVLAAARRAAAAARDQGAGLPVAALQYARSFPGVASVVVGADSAAQLATTAGWMRAAMGERLDLRAVLDAVGADAMM
ncbi:aldo/keto reductase [Leifsonia sp. F6_8S_P_1B]|uniref:Aldo/keto reductase n=1 Tax=Leifsonia williamsii TaxID=3035919 RepID=A0ABT8KBM7_9MICO|nr:aldo/keto reductase [Leifsonia williamsii]MDN4614562.1 aldo/keto reductase [Leifsonia williamsii]